MFVLVPAPNDGAVFVPPNSEVEADGALLNENAMLVMVVTQTGTRTIQSASLKVTNDPLSTNVRTGYHYHHHLT